MSSAKKTALTSFFVLLITVLVVAGALVLKPDTKATTASVSAASSSKDGPSQTNASTVPSSSSGVAHYKDGTYTTTEGYDTPEGTESIGVSITVSNDIVTSTSATKMSRSRESRAYQEDFIASYSSFVVGKKLTDLKIGIVSGASLTTIGFNQALDTIRSQAQS
jgi:uncharacterized protein with FMN-binding domain